MPRPDVVGDARRAFDTVLAGGIVIFPGEVGYALAASDADAIQLAFRTKQRGAHKRHAMLGNYEIHRELHALDPYAQEVLDTLVLDHDLPLGVVARYRPQHPMLQRIDPDTLQASTVDGTLGILVNNGPFQEELARHCLREQTPLLGSSANLTGTGTKFRVEDIQPEIVGIADLVVDHGLRKFHAYQRSSTMIDFTNMEVVRIGSCYDLICDALRLHFGIELPPDPGHDALPSGHLKETGRAAGLNVAS